MLYSHNLGVQAGTGLPWMARTKVRVASPAVLLALQLYTPLSDAWDGAHGVGVYSTDSPDSHFVWDAIGR